MKKMGLVRTAWQVTKEQMAWVKRKSKELEISEAEIVRNLLQDKIDGGK